MDGRHSRTERLLGSEAVENLRKTKVAVIGLGGVGSYVAEVLARAGVENFLLVDSDCVTESNINRQLLATYDTIGQPKTEVAAQRIRSINPGADIQCHQLFLGKDTIASLDFSGCDYIADAIDNITAKLLLAETATRLKIPLISSMGTGNKLNPMAFQVADIRQTSVCPLARVMRRELRKRGIERLDVVFSTEPPIVAPKSQHNLTAERQDKPTDALPLHADEPESPQAKSKPTKPVPASISFVPAAAGLLMASHIVKKLCKI